MSRTVRSVLLLIAFAIRPLHAQGTTETIRGRVTDDSSKVVVGAMVFVTRGPDRLLKQTTTDSAGHYEVVFENGTGDYLIAVSGTGLKSARRRIQRMTTETDLTKPDFRKDLADKLRDAMNTELEKYENFGGIERLIFTGFVVQ